MLLKNKADYVTLLHKTHQTLLCPCRIIPKPYSVPEEPICYAPLSAPSLTLTLTCSFSFSPRQPPSLPATPHRSLINATGHLHTMSSAYNPPPPDVSLAYSSTSFKSLLKGRLSKNVFHDQPSSNSTLLCLNLYFLFPLTLNCMFIYILGTHTHTLTEENLSPLTAGNLSGSSLYPSPWHRGWCIEAAQ